jgi:ribose 5-phosphate isomerase B
MKIAIGADHAGYELKQFLVKQLASSGYEVLDLGTHDSAPVDYPDFSEAVGRAVITSLADRGIIICGSGVGAVVAANKVRGVRAGLCHDTYSAHQGVEHDDMNVLVLGARIIGIATANELVGAFLAAKFSSEDRHVRRLSKISAMEKRFGQ